MKQALFVLSLSLLSVFSATAKAADLSCKLESVVRSPSPASIFLDCGDGFSGHVANEERPTSITLLVQENSTEKREVILNNPPNGIRSYYGDQNDGWILKQLGDLGIVINSKTHFALKFATFPDTLILYRDTNKRNPLSKPSQTFSPQYSLSCFYASKPQLISSSLSTEMICSGIATCWRNNQFIGSIPVACLAKETTCPSASACAVDPNAQPSTPTSVDVDSFEEMLKNKLPLM
jgi:hypothetical protein